MRCKKEKGKNYNKQLEDKHLVKLYQGALGNKKKEPSGNFSI